MNIVNGLVKLVGNIAKTIVIDRLSKSDINTERGVSPMKNKMAEQVVDALEKSFNEYCKEDEDKGLKRFNDGIIKILRHDSAWTSPWPVAKDSSHDEGGSEK